MAAETNATIIIPAYNEEEGIVDVINGIERLDRGYEIIVVDDGSTDDTYRLANDTGAKVIRHPYNKGMGAAIRTGARHAKGDILLFFDGDGQHNPEDIPTILQHIDEYDMVVGARTEESETSLLRNTGNKVLILIARHLSGVKIPDLTSGFRAIRKEVFMEFVHIVPNGFSIGATLTLALFQGGFDVRFVPIRTLGRGKRGRSKVAPLREGLIFALIVITKVVMFRPLKVFLPASVLLFLIGFPYLVYELIRSLNVSDFAILMIVASLIVFFFGLLSDQIASMRRRAK